MNKTDNIQKLKSNLINQIAAGEVVDSPSSVLKELIENSIDAKSSSIKIHISKGGINKIKIKDDGMGMSRNDLENSLERFATSKISKESDLSNIKTLGFRGEALPSISSVSSLSIESKKINSPGNRIDIEYGLKKELSPSSIQEGTLITVTNLFHNVPARKKFLKNESSEYKKVLSIFKIFAISYPDIYFLLTHNNKTVFEFRSTCLEDRVNNIYNNTYNKNLIPVEYSKDKMKITGFLGNLSVLKKRRGNQFCFINGRYVKNRLIDITILNSYKYLIERGEYPFYVLFIQLPTDIFDVNVHPKKLEVKFENDLKIQHMLKVAVSQNLKKYITKVIPDFDFSKHNNEADILDLPFNKGGVNVSIDKHTSSKLGFIDENNDIENPKDDKIWQLHNKYILTEIKSGIIIIDQHVAHERVLYEYAMKGLDGKGIETQKLLFPQTISFDQEDYIYLLELTYYLEKIGFEIREFGSSSIIIEGVPSGISIGREDEIINEILDNYIQNKTLNSSFIEYMAATYACKAAVKAGEQLSDIECKELVDNLFNTEYPYYCPHGRPIIVNLSIDELDKRFERL